MKEQVPEALTLEKKQKVGQVGGLWNQALLTSDLNHVPSAAVITD